MTQKSRFLIDGFPRNEDNVKGWNEVIQGEADVVGIIYIKCSEVHQPYPRTS